MPRRLVLSPAQRAALDQALRRHPKAYVRERAAALLKIADGMSPHAVAAQGLLRPRAPDTVYDWLNRYEAEGLPGLEIRAGRGPHPAFSPSLTRRRHRVR